MHSTGSVIPCPLQSMDAIERANVIMDPKIEYLTVDIVDDNKNIYHKNKTQKQNFTHKNYMVVALDIIPLFLLE